MRPKWITAVVILVFAVALAGLAQQNEEKKKTHKSFHLEKLELHLEDLEDHLEAMRERFEGLEDFSLHIDLSGLEEALESLDHLDILKEHDWEMDHIEAFESLEDLHVDLDYLDNLHELINLEVMESLKVLEHMDFDFDWDFNWDHFDFDHDRDTDHGDHVIDKDRKSSKKITAKK